MLAGKADSFLCNVQMACNICYSTKSTVLFKHDLFGLRSRGAEKPGRLQSLGSQSRTRLCSSITPWFLYNIISSLYLKSPRAKYFYPSLIRALYVSKIYINPSLQFVDNPLLQFLFFWSLYENLVNYSFLFFTFRLCMSVSESFMSVHVVFCDTPVWLDWTRKMQFSLNVHLGTKSLHQKIKPESMAQVVLWFLLLLLLSQQDFMGPIVFPERAQWEGLASRQPPPLPLHIKPVITADSTLVPGFCGMMSLPVNQRISMKREILLTCSFSLRRIWFYFILLTGTVIS